MSSGVVNVPARARSIVDYQMPRTGRTISAIGLAAGLGGMIAVSPAAAENWRYSANASVTETYTSNVDYAPTNLAQGSFVTSVTGGLQINGEGPRLKLNGMISGTATMYTGSNQGNSFAPQVSLAGHLEAIEHFAFVDAQANVSQTFQLPFGPQPGSIVNATQNRYTTQTYSLSPYIQGVFPSTKVNYSVRDDNYFTVASSYGGSSTNIPNTYQNNLNVSMSSGANPWGWTLQYSRSYYNNGLSTATLGANVEEIDSPTTYNNFLGTLVYQVDPQLQVSARGGYQTYKFAAPTIESARYGIGIQWSPTDRTQVGGFLDHTFFGESYSLQVTHRLPNAALSANVSRGLQSYPELALIIPAGAAVAPYLNAAFATRIPDPTAREQAVEQFLARTQLLSTLASPVNFYATSLTLQETANLSLVLVGTRNSLGMSLFYVKSEAVSGQGNVLPPAFQFGQNNTQTGAGLNYSYTLNSMANLGASATYSTTTVDTSTGPLANSRSKNAYFNVNVGTSFGPKTNASLGASYSWSNTPGSSLANSSISALNVFATVSHTF